MDNQIDNQMEKQIEKHMDNQKDKQIDIQIDNVIDNQIENHIVNPMDNQMYNQIDNQIEIWIIRKTNRGHLGTIPCFGIGAQITPPPSIIYVMRPFRRPLKRENRSRNIEMAKYYFCKMTFS